MIEASIFVGPIISALCAFIGSWLAFSTRLTRVETKMDLLSEKVDRHNNVIERTFKLESDMSTVWHRHDELKEEIEKVRERI